MRLIDADLLIESIKENKFTEYCKQMNVPLDDEPQLDGFHIGLIEGAIRFQPTVEVPQWIPCSVRLPGDDSLLFCLITIKNKFGCNEIIFGSWRFEAFKDVLGKIISEQSVIAWMPLPTPYKGE